MDFECIVLDVGGCIFKTKLKTLISVGGSYFSQLFARSWDHLLDSDGHLFIDRDGNTFHVILGYLRHGIGYPLPDDDYKLKLIAYEAQFYKLPELAKAAEKARFYAQLNFAPPKPPSASANNSSTTTAVHGSLQRFRKPESKAAPVLSMPTLAPPLPQKSATITGANSNNNSNDLPLVTRLSRKLLSKKPSKEDISLPKQFRHIVHIGWGADGHRIVVDRSGNDQKTLKAIVQAIYEETSGQPLVYSMVDANENENRSESVEVFFAGPSIRALHDVSSPSAVARGEIQSGSNAGTGFYDNCFYEVSRSDKKAKIYAKPMKMSSIVTDM